MTILDIVIVNRNSTDCAIRSIESIYKTLNGLSAKIFVADNASIDQPERLKQAFSDIEVIYNDKNLGFSVAINSVIQHSNAIYVVLLNPDTVVKEGFFNNVIEYLDNNERIGILGPRIYEGDGSIQGSARRFPTAWSSVFGRKSPLTKMFPNNPISKREFICFNCNGRKSVEVDWVSGACMVTRRKAFDEVGGFDESFFLYWEDTDLCERIRERGWKVVYYKNACIVHMAGHSSSQNPFFSTYHFHRSCFYLFKKHSKWPTKLFIPLVFLGLSVRAVFVMFLHLINKSNKKK